MKMRQQSLKTILARQTKEIRRKGREPNQEEKTKMYKEADTVLKEQLSRVHELLEVPTMGAETATDVDVKLANNHGDKDELKPLRLEPTPAQRYQGQIPVYSACSGFGDAMGKAVRDCGLGTLALAADVNPAARQETVRCHPDVKMYKDCRAVSAEEMEYQKIQVAHLALPCDSFTPAGPQRGRRDEDANLLEEQAEKLRGLYGGLGVPVVTFENVVEAQEMLFPQQEFVEGLQKLFPQYWVRVYIIKAAEIESPVTGQVSYSTNQRVWAILSNRHLHDEPLEFFQEIFQTEPRVAADVMDTDKNRRTAYLMMPKIDFDNCIAQERRARGAQRIFTICDRGPTNYIGTGHFPPNVSDLRRGQVPNPTSANRGGWVHDVVAGQECFRMLDVVEVWKMGAHRDVSNRLKNQMNPNSWLGVAMAHPQNVADGVAISVLVGYTMRQTGGSAEERFLRRTKLGDVSKEPVWWVCGAEASSLDMPGGKSLSAPQEGITMVAKLMLKLRGTDKVACWFRKALPEASQLDQTAREETLGETMIREAREELIMPPSVMNALTEAIKKVPRAHSEGRVCTPSGSTHQVHCWVLEVSEEEAEQIAQTEEGAREGEDLKFRAIKELMKNALRTGRPTYAHLMGKAWYRAKAMPPRVYTGKTDKTGLSLGGLALPTTNRARPGDLECHPGARERTAQPRRPDLRAGEGSPPLRQDTGPLVEMEESTLWEDNIDFEIGGLVDSLVEQVAEEECIETFEACADGSFRKVELGEGLDSAVGGMDSIEEVAQEQEEVLLAQRKKPASRHSCTQVLLARGSDGKLSCPTHRRARDPQGCPWLYKQSANGESSDPSEWIPDKHELASNTFKCTRDGKDREVSARAVFTKQPDAIKDRRADELSVEEKCQRQARETR